MRLVLLVLFLNGAVFAQVLAPFQGCKSDGQLGPIDAPKAPSRTVRISGSSVNQLAYSETATGIGVLAPRGWHCLGTVGSGGVAVVVSPEPAGMEELAGPAVARRVRTGGTMGRYDVAEVIARIFPSRLDFVTEVRKMFELPASRFPPGPYPRDVLTYKSKTMVEYETPPQTPGLGTRSLLAKSAAPISGVAILLGGEIPDLMLLSVRLPAALAGLKSEIVRQVETRATASERKP